VLNLSTAKALSIEVPHLSLFAPCLLALFIRGGKAHSDQIPDRLGTAGVAWLQAAPLINRLLPGQFKS
jgi:hypothetical protein